MTSVSQGEQSSLGSDAPQPDSESTPAQPSPPPFGLYPGDLVEIDRASVNGRAWMSTLAPVLRVFRRGTQGVVLSEPVRSDGMRWIRFFPLDASEHCYVGARFFALVEPGPRAPLAGPTEPDGPSVAESPIRIGDRATTLIDVDVWPAPGHVHASAFHLQANVMTTVLGAPETVDGADWVQIEHVSGSGWVERESLRPFVRGGRWIEVDSATQTLIAWEDDVEVSRALVSTGKPGYPTPAGAFSITHKFPIRRMKASVRGEKWDYPAVPWAMRFRHGGFYLHSNYWSEEFGSAVSHGCVNMPVPYAEWLYEWTPLGTPVWIHR